MADNIVLDAGSGGATVRTDDDGTAHWQYVKLSYGADNTQTIVTSTATNPLPVALSDTDNPVLDSIQTAVETIDNSVVVDDAAFTPATTSVTMAGATFDDTTPDSVDEGDAGALRMSSRRELYVQLRDAAGNERGLNVDASGNITSNITGTVTVDLGANNDVTIDNSSIVLAEDAVHNTGDAGVMSLAVRNDTLAALAGTDGDYAPFQVNASGALYIQEGSALDVSGANVTVVGTGTLAVQEDGAALTALQKIDDSVIVDDAAFTPATSSVTMAGFEFDDTTPDSVDEGDAGAARMSSRREIYMQLRDAAGNERGLNVDTNGDIGVTTALDGTVSGSEVQVDIVAALPAGTNAIGKLAANSGVDIGDVDVTSISAGSNLIGDVGISGARTSGGTTLYKNIDVDESEDQVKGSAGQVYWIHAINLKASVLYLKFYNATAASVTVGSTVPDLTFPIPTQGDTNGAGFTLSIPNGIAFSTAITIACTTGIGDADSGAPGANECVVNLGYA